MLLDDPNRYAVCQYYTVRRAPVLLGPIAHLAAQVVARLRQYTQYAPNYLLP